jgi:deoxyguanosine kinase
MKQIFLSLGSNLGKRRQMLETAKKSIARQVGSIVAESKIYETPAWGYQAGDYLNLALEIHTKLSPDEVLRLTQAIEKAMGRRQKTQYNSEGKALYSSRCIDIDIIYYGNRIIDKPDLKIPHPRMQERNFVLFPLCDIAPDFIHPQTDKTNRELKARLPETSKNNIKEYSAH